MLRSCGRPPLVYHNPMSAEAHILHIVPGLMPGGMELGMAKVISGLSGNGTRHSVVCLKEEPRIADRLPASVDIHCMHARPNEPQLPFRLARLIRQIRPDVIHARNWGAWPDIAVGRLLTRPLVPLIFSFHGSESAAKAPLRRRLASRALVRMTSCLVALSKPSRDMLVSDWGWPEGRVRIIPNGVDTRRFCPRRRDGNRNRLVVGTVGRLSPVKNHALLIRACASLARDGKAFELRIAGQGPERDNILQLARENGLTEHLQLCGHVEDIPAFLNDLDMFALTSDSEQHPNALTEALACGLASVATRVGCVDELMDGGRCGVVVAPGDLRGLVDALRVLVCNPTARVELGAAARKHVSNRYSLDRMLAKYRGIYLEQAGLPVSDYWSRSDLHTVEKTSVT